MTVRVEVPPSRALPTSLVRGVLVVGLVPPALVLWILWIAPLEGLTADRAALAARDFTDLWAAGRLAAGQAFAVLYDPVRLTAFLRDSFGAGIPAQIWPYPPTTLMLAVVIASAPFLPGFFCYTAAGLAALGWAVRSSVRSGITGAAIMLSPAVADNALAGQNGALTAAAMLGGLSCIETRPRLAGMLLGLLVLKPQLGLVVPVCLVAGRHWRVLIAAGLTAATIAAASALLLGRDAWTEYLLNARPEIAAYFEAPWTASDAQRTFVSVFMAMRAAGAGLAGAYLAQAVMAGLAGILVWTAWRRSGCSNERRTALTMVAALAASPWTHGYDMPALAVATALLLPVTRRHHLPLLAVAWIWPGLLSLVHLPPALPCLSLLSILMVASQVSLAIVRKERKNRPLCVQPTS